MIISKNYLLAYTDESAAEKRIAARDKNGRLLFYLNIRSSKTGTPFYLDVKRFRGKEVYFFDGNEAFFFDGETDEAESDKSREALRPKLHYTVPYGWLNDPNGLVLFNGKYHVFCQHNPLGTAWGNMHWHHAVTEDFINFENLGDVLFPDEYGTMFSGSAIIDKDNVSGLGKNTLLIFYTIAQYENETHTPVFSQGLAYSYDGIRFEKYAKNPVVPNIIGENRDPKVVYVPEIKAYIMALYLDGNEYALLKSDNLTEWAHIQTLRLENDGECPDLYFLKDIEKWIFSGASDYYTVGHFDKNGFVAEQKPLRFFKELDGRYSYAAQSFSNLGERAVRLSWENISPENEQCFCGQLSLPFEMSAAALPDGTVRLKAALSREIEKMLVPVSKCVSCREINEASFVADIDFKDDFSLTLDGKLIKISVRNNEIIFGDKSIPLSYTSEKNLRIIVDTMSIELLADNGLIFTCIKSVCNNKKHALEIIQGEAEITLYKTRNA